MQFYSMKTLSLIDSTACLCLPYITAGFAGAVSERESLTRQNLVKIASNGLHPLSNLCWTPQITSLIKSWAEPAVSASPITEGKDEKQRAVFPHSHLTACCYCNAPNCRAQGSDCLDVSLLHVTDKKRAESRQPPKSVKVGAKSPHAALIADTFLPRPSWRCL